MALSDIISLGVSIASSVTDSLKVEVVHEAWVSQNATGKASYVTTNPNPRCIWDDKQRIIVSGTGQVITVMATLTFLDEITPNGAAGRREPIDPRDKITLPNGFVGKIIDSPGSVVNPDTGVGFVQQIMLGAR